MFIFCVYTLIGAAGWVIGQPVLPSYAPRYQLVYLTPPYHLNQYQVPKTPQPILHNRVLEGSDSSEDSAEDGKYEVSQFHSEDANGRIIFGFSSPDQIRMEARDADGTVRGSYSYIDPNGNVVKMQYWDDGSGFHAVGNNLPVAIHPSLDYTPEVKAAREHHLKLYEAALQALKEAGVNEGKEKEKDDGSYIDTSNYEGGDEYEEQDPPPEGGVIIENPAPPSSIYADSILSAEYPNVQFTQTNQLNDNSQYSDEEDKESVSIENPEFRQRSYPRYGKSQGGVIRLPIVKNIPNLPISEEHYSSSLENSEEIHSISRMDSVATNQDNVAIKKTLNDGNRAFSYHFTHTIPMPVERVDNSEEDSSRSVQMSVSNRAHQVGSIPIAGIHDAQILPIQQGAVPNFQIYPIYHPQHN